MPMPPNSARTRKPTTRANEIRFEIVMVKRSLEAANAIKAGNTRSRTASVSMTIPLQRAANLRVARCGFVIVVLEMQFAPAAAGAAAGVNLGIAPIQGSTPASSVRYPPW